MGVFKIIKSWLEGELKGEALEEKKKEVFDSDKELEQYERIINRSANLEAPKGRLKDEIWSDLQQKTVTTSEKSKPITLKSPIIYYSIASVIIILFGILYFFAYDNSTKIEVFAGQQEKIILPDSSEVIINSVSKISFSPNKWEKERIVNLEGEAFFKVKKGNQFTVNCTNGTVEVKGTIFNVFSRENILEVKCTEGEVLVTSISGNTKLLKKSQGTRFTSGKQEGEIFGLNNSNTDLWTKGQFYFESTELKHVFSEIERQFDITIQFTGKPERLFTGYFTNKKIEDALKMVCNPMNLKYEIKNKSLVIIKDKQDIESN